MTDTILEVDDLTVKYATEDGTIEAVSNASFKINEGEFFGLVGESGSGKSTIAAALLDTLDVNGAVSGGTIRYKGDEIQNLSEAKFNDLVRWDEIAMIPQGAMDSLDPLLQVSEQAVNIAKIHTDLKKDEVIDRLSHLFETVGLQESRIYDYPFQFSGGMQQRAVIALALLLEPSLIVADEPTTALDVIMQDQFFKYLNKIKEETGTSLMLITHDISLVFENCSRMAIMHSGQLCETGPVTDISDSPHHPYSILLQQAIPDYRTPNREMEIIEGAPPTMGGETDYCAFVDRCPWAVEECDKHAPPLEQADDTKDTHKIACFRKNDGLRDREREEVRSD